jgi:phage terminase large subunit
VTAEEIAALPYGFVRTILRVDPPPYDWQDKILVNLEDLSGRVKVAVASPNGAGKSRYIAAPAAFYVPAVFPRGQTLITTASGRQLTDQLIPALEQNLRRFPSWNRVFSPYYKITTPKGGTISAFATDDAGKVEGSHQVLPESPLLWILDESKTILDEIDKGVDRCTYTWKFILSSPGLMTGFFYEAFQNADKGYRCYRAGLKDCPHKDKATIDDVIRSYGENHPHTRSTVYGEFMEQDETNRYIVTISAIERCINNPPPYKTGITCYFCDFAAGGDENVIAKRDGNRVTLEAHWREKDKLASVGRFIQHFRRLEAKEDQIWGDASAKDMCDMLAEAGWGIHRKNFGDHGKSIPEQYLSWGSYAWRSLGAAIEKCEIILPNDETLKKQLASRQQSITKLGKLAVEDKFIMMKERTLPSPDRGDAVAGAWAVGETAYEPNQKEFKIPPGYFSDFQVGAAEFDSVLDDMGATS